MRHLLTRVRKWLRRPARNSTGRQTEDAFKESIRRRRDALLIRLDAHHHGKKT